MSENCLKLIERINFWDFPAFFGGVSLLPSHQDCRPATAELQTNNYRRIESEQTVKIRALRLSPVKPNKQNKTNYNIQLVTMKHYISKISIWKPNFFPTQAIAKILFDLHSTHTGDTPCQNWFKLDNLLTQSKINIVKIRYSQNSQFSVWKTIFFPRQALAKILFCFTL